MVAQALNTGAPVTSTLSVSKAGAGSGTVNSSPAGINCGSDLQRQLHHGSSVTLTATAASGSTFAGWSGACTGTGACPVTMGGARAVTATFNSPVSTFTLSYTRAGTGAGTVTSSPAGISCANTCTANFTGGTSVTLTASAASGSTFAGWSGACTGTGSCTVSMTQARTVTATFNGSANTFALTVTRAGAGTGVVTSNPTGINCGSTCTANYASGTSVTLTPATASNSTFAGWSGACSGAGTCTVSMTQARSVTATFNAAPLVSLTVAKAGTGSGTVTSSPAGINCGTTCTAGFGGNAAVTLTATPATGSVFAGWSGSCTGTGSCALQMNQTRVGDGHVQHHRRNWRHLRQPGHVHQQHRQFQHHRRGLLSDQHERQWVGLFELRWRTLTVGGVARTCGQLPLTRAADGYYYFSVTAGQFPWAGLYAW